MFYCHYDNISRNEFNEQLALAIKNSDIVTLRTMNVTRNYFYYACKIGNIEIINMFISMYHDLDMDLALEIACIYRNYEIVRISILNGANVNKNCDVAIMLAVLNDSFECVKILIDNNADIHTFNDICFVLACENGNVDIVNLLIRNDADIHSSGEYEYEGEGSEEETGIYRDKGFRLACRNSHFGVVKLLLDLGINANIGFNDACRSGDLNIVKFLISRGANFSESLGYASRSNNLDLVLYLISIGCKIDLDNGSDLNNARNKEIINFLIENGSSPNSKTIGSLLYFGEYDIAELLLRSYNRNETFDDEMETLISNNNVKALKLLF